MNSDIPNNENVELWITGKCIFCQKQIKENSKILNCLHVICNDCTEKKTNYSSVHCKCNIVSIGELTDYSILLPPNESQICCENDCNETAKKICVYCNSFYCKPCSKKHLSDHNDHNPILMMTYPLKKEFISCPKCIERCVEVHCTKCLLMTCPLCYLKFHRNHDYELLSKVASESKKAFNIELQEITKNDENLNALIEKSDDYIQQLNQRKNQINQTIEARTKLLHEEIDKRSLELKRELEKNFTDSVNSINANKEVLNDFKKENEYYYNLTSSIISYDNSFEFIRLSKVVMDRLTTAKGHTQNLLEEIAKWKIDLVYNDEQSIKTCVDSIQKFGNIIASPIVSLSELKITVNENNVVPTPKNNVPFSSIIFKTPLKKEQQDDRMHINSDTSDYEPLLLCACCNQWAEELINCTRCERFYHNECHIPPISKDFKPKDLSVVRWKCTLCQDVKPYSRDINQKDFTGHIPFGHSERKLIERILMQLYCQNDDSEHYRDCLNREMYPLYYEKIIDPISLNDIKHRLESDTSYTSLIDVLKDMKKVFTNGKLYYSSRDPYYKSANELQISLNKMINLWIPALDQSHLQE